MKFAVVALEGWPGLETRETVLNGIDAPFPQNAAKRIAELGGRGVCILEDPNGNRSAWRLHVAIVHYVYPVSLPL